MTYEAFKEEAFAADPRLKAEYDAMKPRYDLIRAVIGARVEQGISQKELAERAGTKQSNISRFESGNSNPSLAFIQRIADALGMELTVALKERSAS